MLAPEQAYAEPGKQETLAFVDRLIREHGPSGRTCKSALIVAAPESTTALYDEARKLLAWQDIGNDEQTMGRLSDPQKRQTAPATLY
jgi:hypothetical protein